MVKELYHWYIEQHFFIFYLKKKEKYDTNFSTAQGWLLFGILPRLLEK